MKLYYELFSHGWAEASIHVNGQCVKITASYLSDALQDMAYAAVAVKQGANQVRFSFTDEPGEYRWIILGKADGQLEITVLSFPDGYPDSFPDDKGEVMICFKTTRNRFCGEVLSVLNGLMSQMTPQDYKSQWGFDFPTKKHLELKKLIAA